MARQHNRFVLLVCGVALALSACAGPEKSPAAPRLTLESLGATSRVEIDPSARPDPPFGFTDKDIYVLAGLMADVMSASFSQELLAVKGVDDKFDHILSPLKARYPKTVADFLMRAGQEFDPYPWKRMVVDDFAPGSRPRKAVKVLKVSWDSEGGESSGHRFALLRLQVHAAYEVGTKEAPQMIGVRRDLELYSFGLDDWPSLGAGATGFGIDTCVATGKDVLVASRDKKTVDWSRKALKKSLATEGIVDDDGGSRADVEKTIGNCRAKADAQTGK